MSFINNGRDELRVVSGLSVKFADVKKDGRCQWCDKPGTLYLVELNDLVHRATVRTMCASCIETETGKLVHEALMLGNMPGVAT